MSIEIDTPTVTFVDEMENYVSMDFDLNNPVKLDYTDPEAVELEMTLGLRLKDSAGNLWKIAEEETFVVVHLIREDGA